jgi:hypothetical protein
MRKQTVWATAALVLLVGCGGGGEGADKPTPPKTSSSAPAAPAVPAPSATALRTLTVGQAARYALTTEAGIAEYELTLKRVERTADGVLVTFLSSNVGEWPGVMDLNKEYALAPDGERTDDIAVATEDSLTDPAPGQQRPLPEYSCRLVCGPIVMWPQR